MSKKLLFTLLLACIPLLWGCSSIYTRTEQDVYTITLHDTTTTSIQKNTPGHRDNGIIYPSSREVQSERYLVQRDSIVERYYPDFIRLGLFESIGLIGSSSNYKMGTGLFGIFPDINKVKYRNDETGYLFSGGIYRIGIAEWRLRWFRDAPDWTWGFHVLEALIPETKMERALISVVTPYVRKRIYLRTDIPYVAIIPALGFGYYPSQYINLSASLDIGSIGGLNIRAYAGYAAGYNSRTSPQVLQSPTDNNKSQNVNFPYFGIGMSFLDFLNRVPETEREWKDYEHSSWNIGIADLALVASGAKSLNTPDSVDKSSFPNGLILSIANAKVALPILDNRFYLGTSLFNLVVVGNNEFGLGILPIRAGYWFTILPDELTTEPFVEYNYYPSHFVNMGNKISLRVKEMFNVGLILGYAAGNPTNQVLDEFGDFGNKSNNFSRFYIAVNFALGRIFYPQELRYNK